MKSWIWRGMAIAFGVLAGGESRAAMSQLPLTGSTTSVAPNLMFTLDNSSSMEYGCVPDQLCVGSGNIVDGIPWHTGLYETGASVVTYRTDNLLGRRLRSSAINPIYYNPEVRYRPWLKADGTRFPAYAATEAPSSPSRLDVRANLVAAQTITAFWLKDLTIRRAAGEAKTGETIWPAQYYKLDVGKAGDSLGDFTQVIISPERTGYPKGLNRTDCAGSSCTFDEEAQNFSNWFTYARDRERVAKGGTSEAFSAAPSAFRVGFGTINGGPSNIDGVSTGTVLMGVRPFASANRETFYNLLQNSTKSTGTPLPRALDDVGQYFSRRAAGSPWAEDPVGGESFTTQKSCRRAFHVLMTDGLWNTGPATTLDANKDVDNMDGPVITLADGTTYQYKPAAPYTGPSSPSLADVAMYYWNRDLQPDLKNDVPASPLDPASWQHMVTYTIGFGVTGNLRNPEDWAALVAGTKGWGSPRSGDPANVDDLWHAAVNGRGSTASARSIEEYTNALKSMVESIVASSGREAGVAVSGRSYSPTAVKYIPSYKPGDWTGEVEAQLLSDGSTLWNASGQLPAPADRKIYTLQVNTKGQSALSNVGVPFSMTGMSKATAAALGVGSTQETGKLVRYLRGERTEEQNSYRKRVSVLGDIVNSAPVLVKDLVDSQYDFLPSSTPGQNSYLRFANSKKYRTAQLFVGANDGMLHAFSADNGVESFAFIPRAVQGQLKNLANPAYSHQYFVDGPLTEVDVYDATDSKWRNLVIGSGGAGARNLFAINVPVPAAPSSGNPTPLSAQDSAPAASDIRWEISSNDTDYGELGHVLQPPEAGIMQDGTWVIITGNGYDSASKRAQLYVIDARTGERVAVIDTGSGSEKSPNGLGGVKVVRDKNKRIVAAYAGDLHGGLWKFDFSSSSRGAWRLAFGNTPLFWAKNSAYQNEPITAAPAVMSHPMGGTMVFVGTGKLFESDDASSTREQSLYGVWDRVPLGGNSQRPEDSVGYGYDDSTHNTSLVTQTLQPLTSGGVPGEYFELSSNSVDYGSTAQKRGWRIRTNIAQGQRMIYAPQIRSGRVFFDTIVPGGVAASCKATQPQGYTFVVDAYTGAPSRSGPTFDTNGDGQFTSADSATAAITHFSSIGQRRIVGVQGSTQVRLEGPGLAGSTGGADSSKKVNLDGTPVKRHWRQIITLPAY